MTFNPMNFVSNLSYMAVGMVSIFIVIGVIVALTMFLNMVTNIKAIVAEEEAAKTGQKKEVLLSKNVRVYYNDLAYNALIDLLVSNAKLV